MTTHKVFIGWQREPAAPAPFTYDTYSRDHAWRFGTGTQLTASAAATYRGNPALPNPKRRSCRLVELSHAEFSRDLREKKIVVERYDDHAEGRLDFNGERKLAVTAVVLRPRVIYADPAPDAAKRAALHEQAHAECFIANSVKTVVTVEHD